MERESKVEKWLVKEVLKMGGIADKFVSPANSGVPDRIIILPGGKIYFVELKALAGRLSGLQKWQRERYKKLGCNVRVVKGIDQARAFISELKMEVEQHEVYTT